MAKARRKGSLLVSVLKDGVSHNVIPSKTVPYPGSDKLIEDNLTPGIALDKLIKDNPTHWIASDNLI